MSYGQVLQFAYENLVKWFKKCKYLLYPVFWNWLVFISECPLFMKFQRRKSTGPQLYVFSDALFRRLVWNWSHNACSVTWKFQTLDNMFNRNNSDDCCSQLKRPKKPKLLIDFKIKANFGQRFYFKTIWFWVTQRSKDNDLGKILITFQIFSVEN